MQFLITDQEFNDARSRAVIPLRCDGCGTQCGRTKNQIQAVLKHGQTTLFCSRGCRERTTGKVPRVTCACAQCGKTFPRRIEQMQQALKRQLKNHFCSQRCAGLYNAQHRTTGTRRAKLEEWLEQELTRMYLNLDVRYNDTAAIKAELDIYIPSLGLAFELNGVFHYEPIFGSAKLEQTQNKDRYKLHGCTAVGIDLCVLDTSGMRYFKPKSSQRFLDIITKVIDERMAIPTGLAPARLSP